MADEKPKGLYTKLAEVTAAVGRVEKRGRNEHFRYDYVTEADLVDAVRNLLAERQIVLIPSVQTVTREGKLTTVSMTFTFIDGQTGETHQAGWAGTGEDGGDKGLYKAYTGAIKYFLMKSFLIPTGDDPERDDGKSTPVKQNGSKAKPQLVEQAWATDARKRVGELGVDHGEVRMKLTSMNVGKLEELTEKQASLFDQWLSEQADKVAVEP